MSVLRRVFTDPEIRTIEHRLVERRVGLDETYALFGDRGVASHLKRVLTAVGLESYGGPDRPDGVSAQRGSRRCDLIRAAARTAADPVRPDPDGPLMDLPQSEASDYWRSAHRGGISDQLPTRGSP